MSRADPNHCELLRDGRSESRSFVETEGWAEAARSWRAGPEVTRPPGAGAPRAVGAGVGAAQSSKRSPSPSAAARYIRAPGRSCTHRRSSAPEPGAAGGDAEWVRMWHVSRHTPVWDWARPGAQTRPSSRGPDASPPLPAVVADHFGGRPAPDP